MQPPIKAALAPFKAASLPCALREPNSKILLSLAARTIRLVLVAIRLWWFKLKSKKVSKSCASMVVALTQSKGSFGKITSPSRIA